MTKLGSPPTLLLGLQTTALATARCLADEGIQVQVAAFSRATAERRSNSFTYLDASNVPSTIDGIADWVFRYTRRLDSRPVVLPTSDTTALALAKHRDELTQVCHVAKTDYSELNTIVSKEGLYARAESIGVKVPPAIVEPNWDDLNVWCRDHRGPYLVKPFYQNIPSYKLGAKNLVFNSANLLLEFVGKNGAESLIIQRLIQGGDGWVFDCYGLCDHRFEVVTQASHTRIRQFPRNFGTTTYGEIPAQKTDFPEERLFEVTDELLSGLKYHGIFGIEWIEDQQSKELYLIDFNARPFLSIGHLKDCGLNLPLLAYRELLGENLDDIPPRPRLQHKFWLHFVNDSKTLRERLQTHEITVIGWLISLLKARSFATWRWTDMGPSLHLLVRFLKSLAMAPFTRGKA
jgi:predicted ATP-grasp superfamily ATP-dependent carboligase